MDRYQPMTPSHEAPNPLRPYYRAPSIGLPADTNSSTPAAKPSASASQSFGTSARDILSDLNYNEILGDSSPGTAASIKSFLDQAVWKYTSVFMAQPFEVAKLVLQVRQAESLTSSSSSTASRQTPQRTPSFRFQDLEEDDDEDEPAYFTSASPHHQSSLHSTPSSRRRPPRSLSPELTEDFEDPTLDYYRISLKRPDALMEVISQLWGREGAWGIWKGTNVTFLYSILLKTIETWTRSMLSATLNLPDPGLAGATGAIGGLDIIDSPSPFASLIVAVSATAVAGILLSPLDIIRTRIMLTSTASPRRSILSCLRDLSSWSCPPSIFTPTLIHSALPTLISTSTPLFLRSYLQVDPIITPTTYSVCTFFSSAAELFIRLPFETVLRRGQMQHVLQLHQNNMANASASRSRSSNGRSRGRLSTISNEPEDLEPIDTVVEIGPYTGTIATMWRIMRDEGESVGTFGSVSKPTLALKSSQSPRRGQGVQGLWRGWRVGWWGLVGVWGAAAMGGGAGKGGEF